MHITQRGGAATKKAGESASGSAESWLECKDSTGLSDEALGSKSFSIKCSRGQDSPGASEKLLTSCIFHDRAVFRSFSGEPRSCALSEVRDSPLDA